MYRTRNAACLQGHRGFKSHPLRQLILPKAFHDYSRFDRPVSDSDTGVEDALAFDLRIEAPEDIANFMAVDTACAAKKDITEISAMNRRMYARGAS